MVAKDIENIDTQLMRTYERKKGRRGIRVAAVRKNALRRLLPPDARPKFATRSASVVALSPARVAVPSWSGMSNRFDFVGGVSRAGALAAPSGRW